MGIKKKVLLIGSIPPPYHGSSIYFENLLNSEIKNKFDIYHLDISDHRDLKNLSRLDFRNVSLAVNNIVSLFKMLPEIKPDLVYIPIASNFLPYLRDGLFILLTSYFSNAKIIVHLHEGDYFRTGFYNKSDVFTKSFIWKSLGKADTAIVLGEGLRKVFKDLVKDTEVCPNGIKTEETGNIELNKNKTSRNIRVGFLGNLFESKGVLDAVNAAVIVLAKHPDSEFIIAGADPMESSSSKSKADKIIKENNLSDRIIFTGMISGKVKTEFFSKTDIFLFPTWYKYEGFPLVIIEAMSFSIPVISTKDTGAISDIITDKVTGILIEKKNPQKIAEAVNYLIENPEKRIEMGIKGKLKFEKYFTHKVCIENMIRVFNKVLN